MSAVLPNALPNRWAMAAIGELLDTPVEQTGPPSQHETFVYVDIGSVDNTTKRIVARKEMHVSAAPSRARQVLRQGDVLVSMTRPNLNAVVLVTKEFDGAIGSTGFSVLRSRAIEPLWMFYAVQTRGFVSAMCDVVQGALYPAVRPKDIARWVCPVPPRSEQERIASKLDELLSDLDAGVAALERVRAKLKHYRAAVLKAAVEGALTAEWRRQHPATETADALLTRILAERRQRWEETQLAKFEAAGKIPPKDWKAKYPQAAPPDTASLRALPPGWRWVSADQLAWSSGYGTSEKCLDSNAGLAVLRIPNVIGGQLDLHKLKFARPDYHEPPEELVAIGDLLIVRTNGSRTLIGRGAVVREKPERSLSFASYLIRLRLVPDRTMLGWVALLWESPPVRQWIEARAATSAGQHNISLSVLDLLPVPLPPLQEQDAIVEAVEDQLSVIDHLERDLESRLQSAQALRQSILRHAFTGQLVPQDPNDEPAGELLKRIAVEREERARLARAPKQGKPRTRAPRRRTTKE